MKVRIVYYWGLLLSSYWFVPTLMTAGAIGLAYLTLLIDETWPETMELLLDQIAMGDVGGVRALLATVAGSMITIAGVTFSITIVVLSLASQQFGPRILSNFMRDRGNQIVLGTFVATFLYCLLVMRSVGSTSDDSVFMPHLSVTIGLLLGLMSIGVLIFFIHHIAQSIQVDNVIASVGRDLDHTIHQMFSRNDDGVSNGGAAKSAEPISPQPMPDGSAIVVSDSYGYIQAVDQSSLMKLAVERGLRIEIVQRTGKFVLHDTPLARVDPAERCDEEVEKAVGDAVVLGETRTHSQDVEFGIYELVEIALRALSPAINDPFTATRCVDRLAVALAEVQQRGMPSTHHYDENGHLRMIMDLADFEGMVDAAFNQIRQNTAHHTVVALHMLEKITLLVPLVKSERDRAVLRRHAKMIAAGGGKAAAAPADRNTIAERVRQVRAALKQDI